MIDWTQSMRQTFEYYIVDPVSWQDTRRITSVTKCTITRDSNADTLGSATINTTESLGECYIRIYLIAIQNGITEKHPLGTFLVQTPSYSFDGKVQNISMDAYTPLLELKENLPPLGYCIPKGENVMKRAYQLTRENLRAPVGETTSDIKLFYNFVAGTDDKWLSFISDLISNAKYEFDLDEMGRILYSPKQDTASLQPVWTYTDDNSSILLPDLDVDRDLYGIPNVVEVIYSNGSDNYYAKVINNDPNSPVSTVSRGREIVYRETDPDLIGDPTRNQIDEYAEQLLRNLSTLEYSITYSHGYCPVRIRDCVRFDYARANLIGVKAKVISQTIKCETGCQVTEKAVFTKRLWG